MHTELTAGLLDMVHYSGRFVQDQDLSSEYVELELLSAVLLGPQCEVWGWEVVHVC